MAYRETLFSYPDNTPPEFCRSIVVNVYIFSDLKIELNKIQTHVYRCHISNAILWAASMHYRNTHSVNALYHVCTSYSPGSKLHGGNLQSRWTQWKYQSIDTMQNTMQPVIYYTVKVITKKLELKLLTRGKKRMQRISVQTCPKGAWVIARHDTKLSLEITKCIYRKGWNRHTPRIFFSNLTQCSWEKDKLKWQHGNKSTAFQGITEFSDATVAASLSVLWVSEYRYRNSSAERIRFVISSKQLLCSNYPSHFIVAAPLWIWTPREAMGRPLSLRL